MEFAQSLNSSTSYATSNTFRVASGPIRTFAAALRQAVCDCKNQRTPREIISAGEAFDFAPRSMADVKIRSTGTENPIDFT